MYLSNCTDSTDQFFIFKKISQNKIVQAIAPKIHEINSQNLNLADDRSYNNPSHADFPTIPQFHGTITSEAVTEYCLTLPTTGILTIGKCRTNTTIGTFPIQKFEYHDGYLTTREISSCILHLKNHTIVLHATNGRTIHVLKHYNGTIHVSLPKRKTEYVFYPISPAPIHLPTQQNDPFNTY